MPVAGAHRGTSRSGARRAAALLLVVLVLVLAWAGWRAWRGATQLQTAADQLRSARADLSNGEAALLELRQAGEHTAAAQRHLSDPVLRALAALPVVGDPLQTARGLAGAADITVRSALLPMATAAGADPAAQLTRGPGAVDLDYLSQLATPAQRADEALQRAADVLYATPDQTRVDAVDRARADFEDDLEQLQSVVADVALALDVAPELLGQDGPRRYLVLSQSPAEARGTGGLLGGYSLLEVEDGALSIVRSGPRSELQSPGKPVIDLGVQFDDHYGANSPTAGWINSNLSPHLPFAAQIWSELWERQYGEQVDGVLLLDPIALSYLLRATGPVPLADGSQVTADNVVDLTLRDIYARFPDLADDLQRDAVLQQVSAGVAAALTTRELGGRPLLEALDRAVDDGRLMFWSANEDIQERLADQQISGTLPEGKPAVGDVVVDAVASKLGYYLERDLHYSAGCGALSELALTLTNAAPATGLPWYVTPDTFRKGHPAGTNILLATLYLPPRSVVEELTLDGEQVFYRQGTELGLVWVEVLVTLLPGQSAELVATFTEPPGNDGNVERVEQPLVREETFTATGC